MAIKSFKPTTPSRRNMTVTDYRGLSKVKPEKSLLETLKKTIDEDDNNYLFYGKLKGRP